MSETKHTPTPWFSCKDTHGNPVIAIDKSDGTVPTIATIHTFQGDDGSGDAEFIVTACNAHAELLEACKAARETIESLRFSRINHEKLLDQLNAVIASVEGGEG